jgi:hypothetical protein
MWLSFSVFVLTLAVRAVKNQLFKFTLVHRVYFGCWFVRLAAIWVRTAIQLNHFPAWSADKLEAFAAW